MSLVQPGASNGRPVKPHDASSGLPNLAVLGSPDRVEALLSEDGVPVVTLQTFSDAPCEGATTLMTSGLGSLQNYRLHQELLMCLWSDQVTKDVRDLLGFMAGQGARGRGPLKHGDFVGPAGPLTSATTMSGLYVCPPVYFDEKSFHVTDAVGHLLEVYWLVPLYDSEIEVLQDVGLDAFEKHLVAEDPDLLDLNRPRLSGKP